MFIITKVLCISKLGSKKKSLLFTYKFFKCIDMFAESFSAQCRGDISGIWFSADKLFFNDNIFFGFQSFGVAGKIAVGDTQQFLQRGEVGVLIDHQHRHDAEPDPVIKSFIDILDDVLQAVVLITLTGKIISCRI